MWRFISGVAAAVLCLASACATESEEIGSVGDELAPAIHRSVFTGGSASLWGGGPGGMGWSGLDVWQGDGYVHLNYRVEAFDPTSEVCVTDYFPPRCPPDDPACPCWDPMAPECVPEEYTYCYYTRYSWESGWGDIPEGDFRVGRGGARLSTTVASSPSFFVERCTVDRLSWTWECTNEGGGVIDVAWTGNDIYSSFESGVRHHTFGKYKSRWMGQWRSQSADGSGTLVGHDIAGMGDIHSGRNVSIDMFPSEPEPPLFP